MSQGQPQQAQPQARSNPRAEPGLLGVRLFKPTAILTRGDDTGGADLGSLTVFSEASMREIKLFMDETGLTKEINNAMRLMKMLGGNVAPDGDFGLRSGAGITSAYGQQATNFVVSVNNAGVGLAQDYLRRINELMQAGFTYKDAKKSAFDQFKGAVKNMIELKKNEFPISLFEKHAKDMALAAMRP